jgi:hypothetical protein
MYPGATAGPLKGEVRRDFTAWVKAKADGLRFELHNLVAECRRNNIDLARVAPELEPYLTAAGITMPTAGTTEGAPEGAD